VGAGTTGALAEDHRVPVVTIALEFPAGSWSQWCREHEARSAFELMHRDPGRALEKRADALAVELSLTMGTRGASLRATCLKRDFDATLELVKAVLANRRYDEHELKRARRERMILKHAERTDVAASIRRASVTAFFAKDDPRRLSVVDPDDGGTDAAKLVAARDALIRFPGRVVGFAGDLTPDEARHAADGLLPPAAEDAPPDLAPVYLPLPGASGRLPSTDVRVRNLTQVYFSYTRDSVPWTDPRRPAALIADYVLSGTSTPASIPLCATTTAIPTAPAHETAGTSSPGSTPRPPTPAWPTRRRSRRNFERPCASFARRDHGGREGRCRERVVRTARVPAPGGPADPRPVDDRAPLRSHRRLPGRPH
jgi:predicted Zn-dependent peptidase